MRVHCFQHMAGEGPGIIAAWAAARGHELQATHWFTDSASLPNLAELDMLVVLGGAMSVHDEEAFPWLQTEKEYLRRALAAGISMIGICLGSQLLAQVAGAEVGPNEEVEAGFFPVQFTAAARQHPLFRHVNGAVPALHWHYDAFRLPPGALAVAFSGATACQGFVLGSHVVGLQFHPEADAALLDELLATEGQALPAGRYVQTPFEIQTHRTQLQQGPAFLFPLLDALLVRR